MKAHRDLFPTLPKKHTREFVISAMESWFEVTDGMVRKIISLPEKKWKMEEKAVELFDKYSGTLNLSCFEKDKKTYDYCNDSKTFGQKIEQFINKSLELGMLHHQSVPYTVPKFSFSYLNTLLPSLITSYSPEGTVFAWYDYCGVPSAKNIDNFVAPMPKDSVAAVTFSLPWRNMGKKYAAQYAHPERLKKSLIDKFSKVNNYISCIHCLPYRSQRQEMVLLIFTNSKAIEKNFLKRTKKIAPASLRKKPKNITRRILNNLLKKDIPKRFIMEQWGLTYNKWANIMAERPKTNNNKHNLEKSQVDFIRRNYRDIKGDAEREQQWKEWVMKHFKISPNSYRAIIAWVKIEDKRKEK